MESQGRVQRLGGKRRHHRMILSLAFGRRSAHHALALRSAPQGAAQRLGLFCTLCHTRCALRTVQSVIV